MQESLYNNNFFYTWVNKINKILKTSLFINTKRNWINFENEIGAEFKKVLFVRQNRIYRVILLCEYTYIGVSHKYIWGREQYVRIIAHVWYPDTCVQTTIYLS